MPSLPEAWTGFRSGLDSCHWRLLAEWEACWRELSTLVAEQKPGWDYTLLWRRPAGRLASLRDLFEQDAPELLARPLSALRRSRILDRLPEAFAACRREMEELVRALPVSLSSRGAELVDVLGTEARIVWYRRAWVAWRDRPCTIALQDLARAALERVCLRRTAWESSFVAVSAAHALDLVAAWEALAREGLGRLAGRRADTRPVRRAGVRWLRRLSRASRRASRLLDKLRADARATPARLASAIFRGARAAPEPDSRAAGRLEQHFERWLLAVRAAADQLQLIEALAETARKAAEEAGRSVESLREERRRLLRELDALIGWLEHLQQGVTFSPAPPPEAEILPGGQRLEAWLAAVESHARALLPEALEFPFSSPPVLRLRKAAPRISVRQPLLEELRRRGYGDASTAFRQAEAQHRAVLDDIERARKVVEYSHETFQSGDVAGAGLAREALANALSLLRHRRSAVPDVASAVESALCHVVAAAWRRSQLLFELRRAGPLACLRRHGLRDAAALGAELFREAVRRHWSRLRDLAAAAVRFWVARREREQLWPQKARILTRSPIDLFPAAPPVPATSQLYQRLFDPGPLRDPRLLVGRETEMAVIAAAAERWENGRGASVLVTGPPGSGKTSLLNCAALRLPASAEVLRGRFRSRLQTAAEMQDFLRELFGLAAGQPFEPQALAGRRCVVMLEGLERAFLRRPGGYDALRCLLGTIAATSHAILWICTANHACFALLDPLLELSRCFAFRIDSSAVRPADIEEAILLRHRLSGLRLQVWLPPDAPTRAGSLPLLAPARDPQRELFRALHQRSQGIFRLALQVWLESIERIEGGFVYIRPPAPSRLASAAAGLPVESLFSLLALLQHGGLTAAEHALLSGLGEPESRARLEGLMDAGLVEAEPGVGFRIAPGATLEVERALARRNLL